MKKNYFIFSILMITCLGITACDSTEKASTISDSSTIDSVALNPFGPKTLDNGNFAFDFNGIYFEVDPSNAGRISSFSLNGTNILSDKSINATNWGTSLWPSPQSAWGWPPSKQLDVNPYAGGIKDGAIELTSEKDSLLGFTFVKNYKASAEDTSIIVTYTIVNNSNKAQSVAAWEISRVKPGGLTLYPTGKGAKKNLLAKLMVDKNGITWFDYDSSKMTFKNSDVPKLIHDGSEGWLAQVTGNLLLVKKFQDITPEQTAPEEGEIEFYANPDKSYIEIEQQGPYTLLEPGASLSWEVKWVLRNVPGGSKAEIGNEPLAAYIRSLIK